MIIKADRQIFSFPEVRSFTVIGDPGCDGLGSENLDVFVSALSAAGGDMIFLLGDVVPYGTERFYQRLAKVIPLGSDKPVMSVRGNHDKEGFDGVFGMGDYAVVADGFSVVILDNSSGSFSDHSLEFLSQCLKTLRGASVAVMFHIPPPNVITGNSMNNGEWQKFLNAASGEIDRISLLVAGHVHSYFEDEVDGIPLVASGGGGARIEHVDRIRPIQNHIVEIIPNPNGSMMYFRRDITHGGRGGRNVMLKKALLQSFSEECNAHVGYLMKSEDAEQQGFPNLAHLYRALAESELRHARNLHRIMTQSPDYLSAIRDSIASEQLESEQTYKTRFDMAEQSDDVLSSAVFSDAIAAEKFHRSLLETALEFISEGEDIPPAKYHTCASCGMTFVGQEPPKNCPVCGAPAAQLRET